MIKTYILGILLLIITFFATSKLVSAQTTTPTNTPVPTISSTPGAPNTGFGN